MGRGDRLCKGKSKDSEKESNFELRAHRKIVAPAQEKARLDGNCASIRHLGIHGDDRLPLLSLHFLPTLVGFSFLRIFASAPKLTRAHSSGTLQRHQHRTHQRHPAAKLENAHTQLFLYLK